MSRSSPARRSQLLSSPERGYLSSFLNDVRNNETSHLDALAAAQVEHERVRQAAIRVYELHELKEEHDRIIEQGKKEQERLKREAQVAADEKRLQELKAKSIPKPAPPPPPPAAPPAAPPSASPSEPKQDPLRPPPKPATQPADQKAPISTPKQEQPLSPKPQTNGFALPQTQPKQPAQPSAPTADAAKPVNNATLAPAPPPPAKPQPAPAAQPTVPAQAQESAQPAAQWTKRYLEIHQDLKKLRKELQAQAKVPGSPLKGNMGTFRREIRVSVGQLTTGRGANAQPVRLGRQDSKIILLTFAFRLTKSPMRCERH